MDAHHGTSWPKLQSFLLAALVMLTAGYGVAGIAREAAEFGPGVGDIVTFDPAHQPGFDSDARLIAARPGQDECVLNVGVVRRSGGSFVLEQRDAGPDRLYRAHWSGPRTSEDAATDCGADADLSLSRTDLSALAAAAGGFGAVHSSIWRFR
jgi:hypothetical protein